MLGERNPYRHTGAALPKVAGCVATRTSSSVSVGAADVARLRGGGGRSRPTCGRWTSPPATDWLNDSPAGCVLRTTPRPILPSPGASHAPYPRPLAPYAGARPRRRSRHTGPVAGGHPSLGRIAVERCITRRPEKGPDAR